MKSCFRFLIVELLKKLSNNFHSFIIIFLFCSFCQNMEQKLERAILGRMELLHTQLNSKLYFIESKLDALTDSIQQQQQLQPRVFKRDPMHHRRGNGNGNGNIGNGNGNMMTGKHKFQTPGD